MPGAAHSLREPGEPVAVTSTVAPARGRDSRRIGRQPSPAAASTSNRAFRAGVSKVQGVSGGADVGLVVAGPFASSGSPGSFSGKENQVDPCK